MSTNYYLFRHGETDWNKEKRFMGQTDIPLNNVGKEQAINLAERLKELSLIELHSSDLQRTKETAQIIMSEKHPPTIYSSSQTSVAKRNGCSSLG